MRIREPIIISRRLKRHDGTRCTLFGVDKYLGIVAGQEYLISMHMYDEEEKIQPFLKTATTITPDRGPQFIVPRNRLLDDDGLYRITIIDPRDERYRSMLEEALDYEGDNEDGEESDDDS